MNNQGISPILEMYEKNLLSILKYDKTVFSKYSPAIIIGNNLRYPKNNLFL